MSKRLLLIVLWACGSNSPQTDDEAYDGVDLPIGEVENSLDGNWGHALECKPIPEVTPLAHPRIIISIDGMTLHLIDESMNYDRVFPIGPGAINTEENESSFGESRTYYPILATKKNDFKLKRSSNTACKTWWTDPETGEKKPVFAGLPFMPFYGGYAIHGPIDNFTAANGGVLTRGYVSHGCTRMEAADVVEVYGRVGKLAEVPVRLQREPERLSDGTRVDVAEKWIGSECQSDLDCNFDGGFCHGNDYGGRGFCSKRCTSSCPDRARAPVTFCVADPSDQTQGMCTVKVTPKNDACRPQDHMQARLTKRFKSSVTATVCLPGTRGWIGDKCLGGADCANGNTCTDGTCSQPCSAVCPDIAGAPWTTCIQGGQCARVCSTASNGAECNAGESCEAKPRVSGGTKTVCGQ